MRCHAIRIHETGGPEVMRWEEIEVSAPGPGEARLRQTASGLNFVDTYFRSGLYPTELPLTLGKEGVGVVEQVGSGVTEVRVGDRVAYALGPNGSYAEWRLYPADRLVPLPDGISDEQAAAMLLQGMTVEFLIRRTFPVQPGQTVLFHAAAGGVGLIACQWLKHLGATIIGTAGSPEKADLARAHGADHVIDCRTEDVAVRVRELTDGHGVPVVYDGVGYDTFAASIDSLAPRGLLVNFGNSSGQAPAIAPAVLMSKGSLFLTRPGLDHYTATRAELLASAEALFDVIQRGIVRIEVNQTFPLRETAEAHRALENRRTTGSTVLLME